MKTKNIFRMLLVAAALLLGANNVKADETFTLWESPNGNAGTDMNEWTEKKDLDNELLQKISAGDEIKFYGSTITTNSNITVALFSNSNPVVGIAYQYNGQPFINGIASYTVTESQETTLHNTTYPAYLVGAGVNISKVEVFHRGKIKLVLSFSETEKSVKMGETLASPALNNTSVSVTYSSADTNIATVDANTGVVTPVNTGNTNIIATFAEDDTYAEATAAYKVTVEKGDPNLSFAEETMSIKVGETKASPTLNNPHNISAYYFANNTYPVTVNRSTGAVTGVHAASGIDIHAKFDGDNNWNSSEAIYYLDITEAADTRDVVTLAFSASISYATVGETPTDTPTLTATSNGESVSGLAISYTSSNTSVAQVNSTTGAITPVGVGSTIITASFTGDTNYKPAQSVSYTLTVNAAPQTPEYISVNMGDYECRTYVTTANIDFSQSVGIKGYYATGLNSERTAVEFTRVTGIVPPDVPLLLQKISGAFEYKLRISNTENATAPSSNLLKKGSSSGLDWISGSKIYVLTVHNGNLVFAEVNDDKNQAHVDANHAYLDLSDSNARELLVMSFNDNDGSGTTGIDAIENDEQGSKIIYDLHGQRVQNPTKGVYIINGKKMVIK